MMVLYMRNHSLVVEAEKPFMPNVEISRRLGIKISTVNTILRSWRSTKDKMEFFKRRKYKRPLKYSDDVVK